MLLGAFLLSFAFIRMSTRLIRNPRVTWWPGNVTTKGGLHLHHLVVGILLTLVCGFLEFVFAPASPWLELLAGGFGVGAGLTLDEFALWVHLEDVYWAEQGRVSLDAILVATLFGGLLVLGLAPFELAHQTTAIASIVAAVVVIVLLSALAAPKGKPLLSLVGIFVPIASLIGAVRLAAPSSPWARWRYRPDGAKMLRAQARFQSIDDRRRRALDAIGGAPSVIADESQSAAARERAQRTQVANERLE